MTDDAVETDNAARRRELERIAAANGYKPGWVDHQMRLRGRMRRERDGEDFE